MVRVLPIAVVLFCANAASAITTLQIWNNTGKSVLEAGDMVQVLLSHTLDEEFEEIRFCSDKGVIHSASVTQGPFRIAPLSPAPDRKEYLIEFTVPHDFASADTSFFFTAKMYQNGLYVTYNSIGRIAVRGLPAAVTPKDGSEINGRFEFEWLPVFGAAQYHLEVVRFIDGASSKQPREFGGEIALDTHITSSRFTFAPSKTGKYSWVVRAEANGVWGSWSNASTFTVLSSAMVRGNNEHGTIRLFPLPAADIVRIASDEARVKLIEIYDMRGKLVWMEGNLDLALTSFNVLRLSPGAYSVKVVTDLGEKVVQLVKQ